MPKSCIIADLIFGIDVTAALKTHSLNFDINNPHIYYCISNVINTKIDLQVYILIICEYNNSFDAMMLQEKTRQILSPTGHQNVCKLSLF